MKLKEIAWANASAVSIGVIYLACAVLVGMFPEVSKTVAVSWFHGMDLNQIWTGEPRGNFILGLISAVVGTWLVGYIFAWVYNKFART